MSKSTPLNHVLGQIKNAQAELEAYAPAGIDWSKRATTTANTLVPWLAKEAPSLQQYVGDVLNSPALLRQAWAALRGQIDARAEVARIDELLAHTSVLLNFVAGDTVSVVVTAHLLNHAPDKVLSGNSKSDYPDLFLNSADYSKLSVRVKGDKEMGAAIRGATRKPVRVPDGLEIKTSRDNANIDCHYPHMGLHLMLSFVTTGEKVVVDDVLIGFLSRADYRISGRNTEATTVKASFTRAAFVSLLG